MDSSSVQKLIHKNFKIGYAKLDENLNFQYICPQAIKILALDELNWKGKKINEIFSLKLDEKHKVTESMNFKTKCKTITGQKSLNITTEKDDNFYFMLIQDVTEDYFMNEFKESIFSSISEPNIEESKKTLSLLNEHLISKKYFELRAVIKKIDGSCSEFYSQNKCSEKDINEFVMWTDELKIKNNDSSIFFLNHVMNSKYNSNYIVMNISSKDRELGFIFMKSTLNYFEFISDIKYLQEIKKYLIPLFKFIANNDYNEKNINDLNFIKNRLNLLGLKDVQQKVLEMVFTGASNKDIAKNINLSEQAIKYHIGILLKKYKCENRQELRQKIRTTMFS